jgi:hypothetical protein
MPVVFDMFGYKFYFWSKEFINGTDKLEPVHIHVCKGVPSQHEKSCTLYFSAQLFV